MNSQTINDAKNDFLKQCSYLSANDKGLVYAALKFSENAHKDHYRLTGEPYILHSIKVAHNLSTWNLDRDSIIAGLLHDTVAMNGATKEQIVSNFGEEVADIIEGVTKITNIRLRGSTERSFVENLRKVLLVMAKDLRVVFVKLADRVHNLETLDTLPKEKQIDNSLETLEVYAPLAERLGIGQVKGRLEDLAFPYAYPQDYKKVLALSKSHYKNAEKQIERMKKTINKKLLDENVHKEVHGRQKRLYSLWKKLQRENIDWEIEKIHDIVALRVLVDDVADCYAALGIVHGNYKPVPYLGVSDFIAQPKPNGYRSIHTKVFSPDGLVVEIQIRTFQMHQEAEYGIAAHWAYAEAKASGASIKKLKKEGVKIDQNKLSWTKKLILWQEELGESENFLEAVKFNALNHRNFVFSPKGDVYDLPAGATPVDFAYAVHSGLGNYITGAKVNGKIVPLSYKLASGDVVEIMKSKNSKPPTKGWLEFAVTGQARKHILREVRKIN